MSIYISVVSHGHASIIERIACLPGLQSCIGTEVIVVDNVGEQSLKIWCSKNSITYVKNEIEKGFGENNNSIFEYAGKKMGLCDEDYFLVLNPDVYVSAQCIIDIQKLASQYGHQLSTLNLFKNRELSAFDYCVRSFPSLFDFVGSYIGFGNKTIIEKEKVVENLAVDWAAGSFLLFKASLFKKLGGFDPNYFMYCEDIDICWRAKKILNRPLFFYPKIKAVHYAQHANRSFFSKHFIWHVKSMIRYLLLNSGLRKPYMK